MRNIEIPKSKTEYRNSVPMRLIEQDSIMPWGTASPQVTEFKYISSTTSAEGESTGKV